MFTVQLEKRYVNLENEVPGTVGCRYGLLTTKMCCPSVSIADPDDF